MLITNFRLQVSVRRGFAGLVGAVLLGSLSTCGPGHGTDCLMRTGDITTERRALPRGLDQVITHDNVDLILVPDTATFAEVRSGENLLPDIELTMSGTTLTIGNTSKCNWARSYDVPREVRLHVPRLRSISLHGVGNISTASRWQQDSMFVHLVGAGDMNLEVQATYLNMDMYELGDLTLRGTVSELNWTLGGNGRLFADALQTQRSFFRTLREGNGDAQVRASDIVGGIVEGTGTVYYAGPPAATDFHIRSSGHVVAR